MNKYSVTVIMATTAQPSRKNQIKRSIESVISQGIDGLTLCVVVNGDRFDEEIIDYLKSTPGVDYHYLVKGDFPAALLYGREQVKTEFYCFLDDDDELLDDSIVSRCSPMIADKSIDVCIGNGFRLENGRKVLSHIDFEQYQDEPLSSLTQQGGNWLASSAAMFRSASVGVSYFEDYARYAEWTYLAFKLALSKHLLFLNKPVYCLYPTENSLSLCEEYLIGQLDAQERILELALPDHIRKMIKKRKSNMLHSAACYYLSTNKTISAWYFHIKSLFSINGFAYLLFSRRLILKAFRLPF